MGTQKNRLGKFEYPQHMFWWRNKKIIFNYVPGGLFMPNESSTIQIFVYMETFVVVPTGGVSM